MNRLIIKQLLPVCFCVAFFSCKKSDSSPQVQAPVIGGVNERDYNANPMDTIGSPNVYTTDLNNNLSIVCYPNPCVNNFTVLLNAQQAGTIKMWMVAGIYNNPPAGAKVENQSLYTHQSNPPLTAIQPFYSGNNGFAIQVDSLPNGFYKLYAVINSDTLYDNIWISH